ncbi:MAG: hypothetical protein HEP71_10965 [Roseivirga sp.]|nr:hypothetical protein [Roseivirga sp.]
MTKTSTVASHSLVLIISGILIYKGLPILESFLDRIFFLFFPSSLTSAIYFAQFLDLLIIAGLVALIILQLKKPLLLPFDRLGYKHFRILGISFLVIFIGNIFIQIVSSGFFSDSMEEYIQNNEVGLGPTLARHQLFSSILYFARELLLIMLFFVALRSLKTTKSYEWPITNKNERVIPSAMDLDASENPGTKNGE